MELVHMPDMKRQAKQIELSILVNREMHEPLGMALIFQLRHKSCL
jgi:hypothetical protein